MSGTMSEKNFDRLWLEPREGADPYVGRQWCSENQWGEEGVEYVRADLVPAPADQSMWPQCCMCGKKNLSTVEGDGGSECELTDGRWVCSAECWDKAVSPTDHVVGGEPANKADAILRVVRRMIVAENRHLEYPDGTHQRDELDHLLAELIDFTTKDVDEALRIVRRRRAALATPEGGE